MSLDPKANTAGVLMPPPILFGLAVAIGFVLTRFIPLFWPTIILPYAEPVGWGLAVLGLATIAWSAITFTNQGTPVQPHHATTALVINGPYQYSRNPIYLSLILMTFGMAFIANMPWIAIFLVPTVLVLNEGIIKREEAYLERLFGDDYLAYKKSVRRYF